MPPEITIYTDGACSGNPGPGGYGLVLMSGPHRKEKSEGYRLTTNNRMELLAAIVALESLTMQGSDVRLYTDSQYLVNAVNKGWLFNWEKKNFAKKKNPDLWIRFLKSFRKHNVRLIWVKGHNENKENELCDQLAVAASKKKILLEDKGYVAGDYDQSE